MNFEGRVDISLPMEKGAAASVRYAPPVNVSPLLKGKRPQEVMPVISTIYGICANAQAHAAVLALEAALGLKPDRDTARARALVTSMETLRENVLRIALDWPRLIGSEPDGASVRVAMHYVPRMRAALFGEADPFALDAQTRPDPSVARAVIADAEALLAGTIFGEPLDNWLKRRGYVGLLAWAVGTQTPAADLITHLAEQGWVETAGMDGGDAGFLDVAMLAAHAGGDRPAAANDVPETTLFSRRAEAGLVASLNSSGLGARFVARLAELACLPGEMRLLLEGEGDPNTVSRAAGGAGIGIVEAARGLLVHTVRLADGHVDDYRIVSPTDWNFDKRGVAARCLATLEGHDNAEEKVRLAHLVVNAIDPCVAYEVRAC